MCIRDRSSNAATSDEAQMSAELGMDEDAMEWGKMMSMLSYEDARDSGCGSVEESEMNAFVRALSGVMDAEPHRPDLFLTQAEELAVLAGLVGGALQENCLLYTSPSPRDS
eukprot:TRINITY_DN22709_c0_g1_i1.p1 TRINITY_DN22709_c0_g1~~TRINITY_DN22709_c0_g1_i1.p1  ORF type:complete len:122 (-),score=41.48 TRINITY_DN22709_c0_g1_i1:13-345(-)